MGDWEGGKQVGGGVDVEKEEKIIVVRRNYNRHV